MRVLVAFDGKPDSQHVLETICRRHWADDTEFKILSVVETIEVGTMADDSLLNYTEQLKEKRHQSAEEHCEKAKVRLEKRIAGAKVHWEIKEGEPRQEIVDSAVSWPADKIIIGAHSQYDCRYDVIGGVARAVAAQAPCSVEVIRPKVAADRAGEHAL
jgi:nucleotide-binding universal stress UspA family protein